MTREEKEIIFQAAYIRRKDAVYWWKKYNEFPENDIFFDSWRAKESRYLVIKEIIDKTNAINFPVISFRSPSIL